MPEKKRKELDPEVEAAFKDIIRACELEDEYIRSLQIKLWKKHEEYWHGVQFLFWSEIAQDWMTPENGLQVGIMGEEQRENVGPFYDYVVNMFKAHGESMIAALTQGVPTVEFFPDDADNPDDLTAAQAKNKLAIIFQKHVKAKLRLIEALHKIFNQGVAFFYRYRHEDTEYGVHKVQKYSQRTVNGTTINCPSCGKELTQNPNDPNAIPTCPECNMQGTEVPFTKQELYSDGINEIPKARECLEVYGPLNVKVPYYKRKLKECGYLLFFMDIPFWELKDKYPEWADEIKPDAGALKERWARTPSSYSNAWRGGSEDTNLTGVERIWLRPEMYEILGETKNDVKKKIKEQFSKGAHLVQINNRIMDWDEECLDICWTMAKSGPSTFIHSDPLGQPLAPLQEAKNQLFNLTIQTIEYGVPSLFADSRIINRDQFQNQESSPGLITSVRKPAELGSLADGFYEQKIATPSKEIEVFEERIEEDAQFVSGDYPSIYGGPGEGKTRTLGEYVQSGQRALARLGLAYEFLKDAWIEVVDKSVDAMETEIKKFGDPEQTVVKEKGQFENISVNPEDLLGNAGKLEPEASEGFPISSDKKMGILMQLIQLQNPMVESVVAHPENSHIVTEALGMPDLYIPGEAQRQRCLTIIRELINSVPQETAQGIMPSIEPEDGIDDEEIQIAIIQYFLSSDKGMQIRKSKPAGYANCKAYFDLLRNSLQMKMMQMQPVQEAPPEPKGRRPAEKPPKANGIGTIQSQEGVI